jgi:hypothetical protein
MLTGLAAGDVNEQVGRAWIAVQELRLLYRGVSDRLCEGVTSTLSRQGRFGEDTR